MTRPVAVLLAGAVAGVALGAGPRVISWRDAARHVGEVVTVEGRVADARAEGDTYVIDFAPDDPQALRAVLVVGILSTAPRHLERRWRGRDVRVTGLVRRFAGRPEIVIRDPDLVQVVGDEPPETRAAPSPPPAPPQPPPAANERGLVGAVQERLGSLRPCERARAAWRTAAGEARARADGFAQCAAATSYRCADEASALIAALEDFRATERDVEESCP
jgi:hypothetical protein